jgi:hypothetical protein
VCTRGSNRAPARGRSASPLDGKVTPVVGSPHDARDPPMTLVGRLARSLPGHIALFEFAFSAPLFLFFVYSNFEEGTLTAEWLVYLAVLWISLGAVGAVFFWYAVSLPLIKRRDSRDGRA